MDMCMTRLSTSVDSPVVGAEPDFKPKRHKKNGFNFKICGAIFLRAPVFVFGIAS